MNEREFNPNGVDYIGYSVGEAVDHLIDWNKVIAIDAQAKRNAKYENDTKYFLNPGALIQENKELRAEIASLRFDLKQIQELSKHYVYGEGV